MGDDSIDTVILHIDMGYLVTLLPGPAAAAPAAPAAAALASAPAAAAAPLRCVSRIISVSRRAT